MDFVALTESYIVKNHDLGEHLFHLDGRVYVVHAGVFSPRVFEDTSFFVRALDFRAGQRVLEIGCGAGVIAVGAALAGASGVFATDVNLRAVQNTEHNAALHGVAHLVRTGVGDLFGPVPRVPRFDVIFWNPPFICHAGAAWDGLGCAVFDPDYRTIRRYFGDAGDFLAERGRLLIGFSSTSGDKGRLDAVAAASGWSLRRVAAGVLTDETCPEFSLELYQAERVAVSPPAAGHRGGHV